MRGWLQRKLFKFVLKNVFKVFEDSDILFVDKSNVFIGEKKISDETFKLLKSEAKDMKSTTLLPLLLKTLRFHAHSQIMYRGTDMRIIDNNRMVLHVVAEIEKFVNMLATYDKKVSQSKNNMIQ